MAKKSGGDMTLPKNPGAKIPNVKMTGGGMGGTGRLEKVKDYGGKAKAKGGK